MNFNTEEKAMWLSDWKQSGMNACAYAKENGLIPQTFYRWIKAENGIETDFVEVPTEIMREPHYAQQILIERGDVKIYIPCGIGKNELQTIMAGVWRV